MLTLTALRSYGTEHVWMSQASVPYINLQWNRKLFSAGSFEVTLAEKDYTSLYGSSWSALMVAAEDETPYYQLINTRADDPNPAEHYEVGLIYKRTITHSHGERLVTLSGLMGDVLLDGAVFSSGVQYTSSTSVISFISARWPNKQTYTTTKAILNPWGSSDENSFEFVYGWSETRTNDYKPEFEPGLSFGKHMRTVLENRSAGLAVAVSRRTLASDITKNYLCFFVKQGEDKSGSITIGEGFGNSATEEISVDSSAGYRGELIYFGSSSLSSSFARRQLLSHTPNSDLPLSMTWHLGCRAVRETSANEDNETEGQFLSRTLAAGDAELRANYSATYNISVDVSTMDRGTLKKIGLGDWVSLYISTTGSTYKTQVVEIHETVKAQAHTTELVLGSKRLTNIQRAKLY